MANKKYTKNKSEKMYFAIFAACFGSIKHILFRKLRYDTSEWLELYCKTDGILRKDFVSLPLDYFEHTGFDLQYSVLDYFPLEKIIGELCWVHNEQKTFGKIHVKTEL